MLPNWLYGKSKSKLANILGGGGGTPADYDQVKAQVNQNTEDIELLSDALDDKAALTQITNPNILHNPWFQVNQRGAASITTNDYFVDRWRTYCANTGSTTFTLNSDGTITIDNSLGEAPTYLIQRRTAETISRIAGRVITASVMLSDGTVRSGTGTYVATATTNYYEDDDIKLQSVAQTAGQFLILVVAPGKTVTIKALKLELGSVSTLAMDTAPEYALELAKCQRYFQRISGDANSIIDWGFSSSGNIVRYCIHIKEMRTKPTITYRNVKCGDVAPSSFTLAGYTSGRVQVNASVSSASTANVNYRLLLGSDGYIDFDAEL